MFNSPRKPALNLFQGYEEHGVFVIIQTTSLFRYRRVSRPAVKRTKPISGALFHKIGLNSIDFLL